MHDRHRAPPRGGRGGGQGSGGRGSEARGRGGEALITAGRVTVNDEVVTELGARLPLAGPFLSVPERAAREL